MTGPTTSSSSEATPLIPSPPDVPRFSSLLPRPAVTTVVTAASEAYRFRHFVTLLLLFILLFLSLFTSLFFDRSIYAFGAVLLVTLLHTLFLLFVILFRLRPRWVPKRFLLSHFAHAALLAPAVVAVCGMIAITFATGAAVLTDVAIVAAFKNAFPEAASAFAHDVSNLVRVKGIPLESVLSTNVAITAATGALSAAATLGNGRKSVLHRLSSSSDTSGHNIFQPAKTIPSHVVSRTTMLTTAPGRTHYHQPTRKVTTLFIPPTFSGDIPPASTHTLHPSTINTASRSSSSSSSIPSITTSTLVTALYDYARHVTHTLFRHPLLVQHDAQQQQRQYQHQQSYTTTSTTTLGSGRIWKDMLAAGATPASLLSMVVGFIVSLLLFYGVFGLGTIVLSVIWMQYKLLTHFFKSSNLRDHLLRNNANVNASTNGAGNENDNDGFGDNDDGGAGQSFHAGELMTMSSTLSTSTTTSSSAQHDHSPSQQSRHVPLLTSSDVLAISLLGATGFSLVSALVNVTILIDTESWLTTLLALIIVATDTLTIGAVAVGIAAAYTEVHVLKEPKVHRVWTHMMRKTFVYCFGLAIIRPFIPGQYGGPSMLFVTIVGAAAGVRFLIAWHYGLGLVARFNRMYVREQTMRATMGRREGEGEGDVDVVVMPMSGNDGGEDEEQDGGYGKDFDA